METKVIFCACHNKEHQLVFEKNEEDGLVYAEMHLTKLRFWKRMVLGVKYIFGYQSRYGAFDEIIFDKNHSSDFIAIGEFLKDKPNNKFWV